MACDCEEVVPSNSNCSDCETECLGLANTSCLVYNGVELPNIGIDPSQGVNDVFVAIDDAIQGQVLQTQVTIPSASVLLLYSTPYTLINAPGSGKYIQPISIELKMDTSSVAYGVAGSNLRIKTLNATNPAFIVSDSVLSTTNTNIVSKAIPGATGYDVLRVNDPLQISHQTANPTAGDEDLLVIITYLIKTI